MKDEAKLREAAKKEFPISGYDYRSSAEEHFQRERDINNYMAGAQSTASREYWGKDQAVSFANWIDENYTNVAGSDGNKWINYHEHTVYVNASSEYRDMLCEKHGKTTEQLYDIFQNKQ